MTTFSAITFAHSSKTQARSYSTHSDYKFHRQHLSLCFQTNLGQREKKSNRLRALFSPSLLCRNSLNLANPPRRQHMIWDTGHETRLAQAYRLGQGGAPRQQPLRLLDKGRCTHRGEAGAVTAPHTGLCVLCTCPGSWLTPCILPYPTRQPKKVHLKLLFPPSHPKFHA